MTFLEFIFHLPLPESILYIFTTLFTSLVAFGIYKFVKDWLPW